MAIQNAQLKDVANGYRGYIETAKIVNVKDVLLCVHYIEGLEHLVLFIAYTIRFSTYFNKFVSVVVHINYL